jgi:uncharacterized damage-inducible protein DinB
MSSSPEKHFFNDFLSHLSRLSLVCRPSSPEPQAVSWLNIRHKEQRMKLIDYLLAELDREVERSRRALEQVPEGKYDWKPHEKSMIFGYLANMVATIPMWITMQINQPELDVAPADGGKMEQKRMDTSAEFIAALDKAAEGARAAFKETSDEHLMTNWRLLARGNVVMEAPRYEMIQDTINHWTHHRGQMTVYLRLMGAKVPAIYGPSADDSSFQ